MLSQLITTSLTPLLPAEANMNWNWTLIDFGKSSAHPILKRRKKWP
ncbi:hypothetical protein V6Z12_D08G227000 [Gossypium hirsutum]